MLSGDFHILSTLREALIVFFDREEFIYYLKFEAKTDVKTRIG